MREPRSGECLIRANWAKFSVACLKRLEASSCEAVLRSLPDDVGSHIREAGPLAWLSAEIFLDLAQAVADALPDRDAIAYWRMNLRRSMEQPFIKPLVEGGLFLFGRSPAALIRRTPQSWQLVSKGCGKWHVAVDEDAKQARVCLEDLAPAFRGHEGFLRVMHGGLQSILEMGGARGAVQLHTGAYDQDRLLCDLTWQ